MAQLTILTPEQLAERDSTPDRRTGRRRSSARTQIIDAYEAVLAQAAPGYGAEVELEDGDTKAQVRQNLHAAAADLGLALAFGPIRNPARLALRVITLEEQAARPKRGGRRRTTDTGRTDVPPAVPVVDPSPLPAPATRSRRKRTTPRDATL